MNRSGYVLVVVLVLCAMISVSAMTLWSITNVEQQIATNTRMIAEAKLAAQSGLSHFTALNLQADDISGSFHIPEYEMTPRTSYEVVAEWHDNSLFVVSKGKYKKAGQTIFEYPVRAIFMVNDE